MLNIKTLLASALLSTVAVVSFAQAPAVATPNSTMPAASTAPDAMAKPAAKAKKAKKPHTAKKKAAKPAADAVTK
jgi:hypothetical protein